MVAGKVAEGFWVMGDSWMFWRGLGGSMGVLEGPWGSAFPDKATFAPLEVLYGTRFGS